MKKLSKFAEDRARAYAQLFDSFTQERQLDHDDSTWSKKDRVDFYVLAEQQDAEWEAKRPQRG